MLIQATVACRPSVLKELHNRNFEDESQRLVFLNDCHLDDPIVLQSIAAVLHGYDGLPEGPPPVITLLGPFFKPRCGGSAAAAAPQPTMREMTAAFEALAAAINLFPAILARLPFVALLLVAVSSVAVHCPVLLTWACIQ